MVVPQIAVNKIRVRNSSTGEPPSDFELPLRRNEREKLPENALRIGNKQMA